MLFLGLKREHNFYLMKVETFTAAILQKMIGIGKCQTKFIIHIVSLYLTMRCKLNFLMFSRYGGFNEKTYRHQFGKSFNFGAFNAHLIDALSGLEKVWLFDPSYLKKSGKHTPGAGYFWSGCAQTMKWGF